MPGLKENLVIEWFNSVHLSPFDSLLSDAQASRKTGQINAGFLQTHFLWRIQAWFGWWCQFWGRWQRLVGSLPWTRTAGGCPRIPMWSWWNCTVWIWMGNPGPPHWPRRWSRCCLISAVAEKMPLSSVFLPSVVGETCHSPDSFALKSRQENRHPQQSQRGAQIGAPHYPFLTLSWIERIALGRKVFWCT